MRVINNGMIIENGTGLASADSYTSTETVDAFHIPRSTDAWIAAGSADKVAAILHVTDYVEATYSAKASPKTDTQALQWPTVDAATVDARVIKAVCILAPYALTGPLLKPTERGIKIDKVSSKAGGVETTYDDPVTGDFYPDVTKILSPIATLRGEKTSGAVMGTLS